MGKQIGDTEETQLLNENFFKVNKCAQFVRQATIVCLMEAHLPVCVCVRASVSVWQRTWLCVSARKDKLHLRV